MVVLLVYSLTSSAHIFGSTFTDARCSIVVVLICISLIISGVELFLIDLLVIYVLSLGRMFMSFAHFKVDYYYFFAIELYKFFMCFGY